MCWAWSRCCPLSVGGWDWFSVGKILWSHSWLLAPASDTFMLLVSLITLPSKTGVHPAPSLVVLALQVLLSQPSRGVCVPVFLTLGVLAGPPLKVCAPKRCVSYMHTYTFVCKPLKHKINITVHGFFFISINILSMA